MGFPHIGSLPSLCPVPDVLHRALTVTTARRAIGDLYLRQAVLFLECAARERSIAWQEQPAHRCRKRNKDLLLWCKKPRMCG